MNLRSPASVGLACAVALSAGLLAGCQTTAPPAPSVSPTGASSELANLVPEKIRKDGVLVVGIDPSYPPMEYLDRGEATGADLDLMTAIAAKLGLQVRFAEDAYALLVPGVAAGRFEAAISALSIDEVDLQNANMVTYFKAGSQLAVKPPAKKRRGPTNLCNRKVSVLDGSVQYNQLVEMSANCVEEERKPINIVTFPTQEPATQAVINGDAYGTLADSPLVQSAVAASNGALVVNGKRFDVAPYGIAVSHDDKERPLGTAIKDALQAMIDDGTYEQILDKWNISDGAIDKPRLLTRKNLPAPTPSFTQASPSPTGWASPTP